MNKSLFIFMLFLFLFLFGCFANRLEAQITVISSSQPKQGNIILPYDSLSNISEKNFKSQIGQTIYLMDNGQNRDRGYWEYEFYTIPTFYLDKKKEYKLRKDKSGTEYTAVANRYYKVKQLMKKYPNEEILNHHYIYELEMQDAPFDVVYYKFSATSLDKIDFLNVGYLEKTKQLYKDQIFYNYYDRNDVYSERLIIPDTNEAARSLPNGVEFICTDVAAKNEFGISLFLILSNPQYGTFYCPVKKMDKTIRNTEEYAVIRERENSLIERYGQENFDLMRAGKVRIGWNYEMCREAWGEPRTINTSTTGYGSSDQWVYYSKYLYFKDGKLVSIQD